MTDRTGTTVWDYTHDGVHLTAQATPQGTVYYDFDGAGRRSLRQLVGTGFWNYSYDINGRLKTLSSPSDGTTTYNYDAAGRMKDKTKGDGDYELYSYDVADQLTSIGYWYVGGVYHNGLTYSYDPAGNVKTANQGFYATTYGYDGADQLTGETSTGGTPPPSLGFTYDHNGNRLTQTSGGAQVQSFVYNAHDVLTSGTAGNETDGYDLNGNEISVTIGGGTWRDTYDDEDRLTSVTPPGRAANIYTYNGLGLRVGKTDSTGTYSYVCDGTTPGSPVLADGHTLYTPGLSENRSGASVYYSNDRLGNLWSWTGRQRTSLGTRTFRGSAAEPPLPECLRRLGLVGGTGARRTRTRGLF